MDFTRIAIVNRGEPAMRLIHAVRELTLERDLDLRTIALYTDPDEHARFVREADERHCLGAATFTDPRDGWAKSTYLDLDRLEQALLRTGADAAWVGWGFVAEHASFAELCQRIGVRFIGPSPDVLRKAGDKITAKRIAEAAGVPVAPWSGGPVETVAQARAEAARLGYPVMLKATAGGGGRGIRRIGAEGDLAGAFASARAEALKAFGDDTVFLEQLLGGSRHIEVQIIADEHGMVWPLGVRDCSAQRRNQKVLEEAPSPALLREHEDEILEAATRLAKALAYTNAGTVELLFDPPTGRFVFMEVNARLQVEHPVTEITTRADLVKLQLAIAAGEPLEGPVPATVGHAIEARLNAEDADNDFAAAPGVIEVLRFPTGPGLRIDTGVEEGDVVPAEFDSMIAKVIAYGRDRPEAVARLHRALAESTVLVRGGASNRAFLQHLVAHPDFRTGDIDIGWIDRLVARGAHRSEANAAVALCDVAIHAHETAEAFDRSQFFATASAGRPRVPPGRGHEVRLRHAGTTSVLTVWERGPGRYLVSPGDLAVDVVVERVARHERRLTMGGRTFRVVSAEQAGARLVEVDGVAHRVALDDGGAVRAPAPGVVVDIPVQVGDTVEVGMRLVVLEAMKMETSIRAEVGGRVREVVARVNAQVGAGDPLLILEQDEAVSSPSGVGTVDFSTLVGSSASNADHSTCRHRLAVLRQVLLGYDVDPDEGPLSSGRPCADQPAGPEERRRLEDEILAVFVDVAGLFRRRPGDDEGFGRRTTEEYLFSYLRDLRSEGRGLPDRFLDQLRRALCHYGVDSLEPTEALRRALYLLAKSQQRMDQQTRPVMALLEDRLVHAAEHRDDAWRALLGQIAAETRVRWPAIHDLAEEVRYRTFDQPFLQDVRTQAYADAEAHLAALAADPDGEARAVHIDALAACTQPLRNRLSQRFVVAGPGLQRALLEVMTRRYYRVGEIGELTTSEVDGLPIVQATCRLGDRPVVVLSSHVALDRFTEAVASLGAVLAAEAPTLPVHVDVYAWYDETPSDLETTAAQLASALNAGLPASVEQVVVALTGPGGDAGRSAMEHVTYRRNAHGFEEVPLFRALHPALAERLELWRLDNFALAAMPSVEDVYLFHGTARQNRRDERLFVLAEVRDLTPMRDARGRVVALPELERIYHEALNAVRRIQGRRPDDRRMQWNRVLLHVWPTVDLAMDEIHALVRRLAPATEGLGLEKVILYGRMPYGPVGEPRRAVLEISNPDGAAVVAQVREPHDAALEPLSEYAQRVVALRRRGLMYPYELVRMLAPAESVTGSGIPPGAFQEYDLADGRLVPVERPPGQSAASVVVGVVSNVTERYPEGMRRVIVLGDASRGMGALAEPECARIMAAIELAEEMGLPVEWFAVSAGALIAMESGTENMDWIARVLRRLVGFTQAGGEVNVVVAGVNVGAQPYWNAEATMLMHTRGILVMTPESAMVLTGKQALDYSGGVSAEDNQGIGGYERIMGPNGQAQYLARDLADACRVLLRHYEHAYVAPGERFPREAPTADPFDRDVSEARHGGDFATVGEVFSEETNPGRKRPFEIRAVMASVVDQDHPPLERWYGMQEAETAVVWDAHLGGQPVCVIGIESKPLSRLGFVPADGPETWTSGTLFPLSSKKVARAINAASGSRPLVVLANLSGFDGSPESMRRLQLEYGAEIGRAIVNFRGPIVFCVVARYHGGAFVVFSKALHDNMEVAALEGSHASVIGGAPAAAVVFAREVEARTRADERLRAVRDEMGEAEGVALAEARRRYDALVEDVRSEKLGEVASAFDAVHSVQRALEVGSIDRILPVSDLRPYLIDAVSRGMRREGAGVDSQGRPVT